MVCIQEDLQQKTLQLLSLIESSMNYDQVESLETLNDKLFEGCMSFYDAAKPYHQDMRILKTELLDSPVTALSLYPYVLPMADRFLTHLGLNSSTIKFGLQKRTFMIHAVLFLNRWLSIDPQDENQAMYYIQEMIEQYQKTLEFLKLE